MTFVAQGLNKRGNLRTVFWASIQNRVVTKPARHWNSSERVMPKLLTHVSSRQKCIIRSTNSEYVMFCFPPLLVMLQDGLIWDQVLYWRGALPTIDILVRDWMVATSLHYKWALINWNNFSYLHNRWPDTKVSIRNLVLTCKIVLSSRLIKGEVAYCLLYVYFWSYLSNSVSVKSYIS